ncbi:cysteine-rich receptor-like protein kinase 25 isoform X2 [Salvia miltiorrhiza]|uniref:cysteine-rich receptor-like protein kinase 25 isoform X2 n=1 Tax=Salvia miltiorrhiza TaxID=226208 RepID=UPI0025AC67F1|nr:cysteine-rich receptor-like protein kinase 25 isoform X2 [Salvia miltiorrhiza]
MGNGDTFALYIHHRGSFGNTGKHVVYTGDIGTNLDKEDKKKLAIKLISASLAVGVLVASFINGGILYLTRRKWRVKAKDEDIDLPTIKMAALVEATNNFSSENMIGSGGFGSVYKVICIPT